VGTGCGVGDVGEGKGKACEEVLMKCPECKTDMVHKFIIPDAENSEFDMYVYQCPKCKTIEAV
jgi:phage FluMu protein Com